MLKFDAHLDREILVDLVFPPDGHHLFAFCSKLAHVSAAIDVNDNAFTGADVPMPYAVNLEKLALPQLEHIIAAAKRAAYFQDAAE